MEQNKKKILLVDAYSMICRGFYALPLLTTSKGDHTNALLGFLNILFRTIDDEKPDYIAITFDEQAPTFRHKIYNDYKAKRLPMPKELKDQVPYVKEIVTAMNIKIFAKEGYEADDILGTLAYKFQSDDLLAVILSGDKDMLQLANKNVKIRLVKTIKKDTAIYEYYDKDVEKEFGFTPTEFIDFKAIMGDPSDNIKGVKGIGEKGALFLISKYKSIENVYEHRDEISKNVLKKAIENGIDDARFCKNLVTIRKDVPLDANLDELKIDNIFNENVFSLIDKFELKSLYKRFNKSNKVDKIDKLEGFVKTETDIDSLFELDNKNQLYDDEIKKDLVNNKYIVINDENEIFDKLNLINNDDSILNIGIFAYGINTKVFAIAYKNITYIFDNINIYKDILLKLNNKKIFTLNLKKQLHYFDDNLSIYSLFDKKYIDDIFDLSLIAYLISPIDSNFDYDSLSKKYLNIDLKSEKDILGKSSLFDNLNFVKESAYYLISLISKVSYYLSNILVNKLKEYELENVYNNIDRPLIPILYNMEKIGIKVKMDELKNYADILENKISIITKKIYDLAGKEFNINSPKVLQGVLFDDLKLTYEKSKNEKLSTSIEVLEKLKGSHEIIDYIIDYRLYSKLYSTYAIGLSKFVKDEFRIHTNFNQLQTATGRLSSDNPNLQNIPIKTEMGRMFRKVFVPRDGYIFIDADYSQIELRILAIISKDDVLINNYKNASDIHSMTASTIFNVPIENVTEELRRKAKAVNFGIVYGISAFGLSEDLHIDRKESKEYITKYFEKFKKVKEYLDNIVITAKNNGYTRTLYNRIRPIPEFMDANPMKKGFAKRVAMNSPIQGTASDILKIAIININKELIKNNLDCRLILQVHDEVLFECKIGIENEVIKIIEKCMTNDFTFSVKLVTSINIGETWGDAH